MASSLQGGEEVLVNPYSDPILEPVKLSDTDDTSNPYGIDPKTATHISLNLSPDPEMIR